MSGWGRARTYSVVIPVRNRQLLLDEAIASAQTQTLEPLEIIVVDDGSTPPIAAPAENRGEPVVRLLRQPINSGAAVARNIGAQAARGTHVAFLDSDDVWLPTHLAAIDAAFECHPTAPAAYSLCRGERGWRKHLPYGSLRLRRLHARRLSWPPPTWLTPGTAVRRQVFLEAGGFAEHLTYREDTDLWIRLCEVGKPARTRRITAIVRQQAFGNSACAMSDLHAYRKIYFEVLERQIGRLKSAGTLSLRRERAMRREVHRYWAKLWASRKRWPEARFDARQGYFNYTKEK